MDPLGNGLVDIRCYLAPGRFEPPCYRPVSDDRVKWCDTITDLPTCLGGTRQLAAALRVHAC